MEIERKLRILADAAKYDASCASSGSRRASTAGGIGNTEGMGICHSYTPDGRCVSLLKILLTNYCLYDCSYCINRVSSDVPRARFTPEEVATLTMEFYKRNYIEGLFLSSGVIQNIDYTMEQIILSARLLREQHRFGGYIHLKAVPGASPEALAEAGRWADRLSVNIELPRQQDLDQLAPAKTHVQIEQGMSSIQHGILEAKDKTSRSGAAPVFAPAGQSTQMIVGATSSSDAAILSKASGLYQQRGLRRVYYSAFSPIPHADSNLPLAKAPLVREHRLYQADWLLRFYGFSAHELTETADNNLPLERDPKLDWALRHRAFFPVDVNSGTRRALLRVPGFGVRNVKRILRIRRYHAITLGDLAKLKVPLGRARYFIITSDSHAAAQQIDRVQLPNQVVQPKQLELFDAALTARTGEL